MTRLALLPENTFVEDFKKLRADLEEVKNAQRSGRDIFVPKIVECLDGFGVPTAYDLIANVPDGFGGYLPRNFVATMIADTQQEPWAVPIYKVFYGNPSTPIAGGQLTGFSYINPDELTPGQISYEGYFGDNVFPYNKLVYLKVYFYATDTGNLSVAGDP